MKNVIVFSILTILLLGAYPHKSFASGGSDGLKYYYKGASPGYQFKEVGGSYQDSYNEWVTFTTHQFFNHDAATGRAKIKAYSRIGTVKKEFGFDKQVAVYSAKVGLADAESGALWIEDLDPIEGGKKLIPEWAYKLAGEFGIYGTIVDILTNNFYAGIEYVDNTRTKKSIEAFNSFGLDYTKLDAPTSHTYTMVEEWSASQEANGNATGFTGWFLYNIGDPNLTWYKLRSYAEIIYEVSDSDFLYSYPVYSNRATFLHSVNTY